jgi:uncharacterized delta-60 repeat protein
VLTSKPIHPTTINMEHRNNNKGGGRIWGTLIMLLAMPGAVCAQSGSVDPAFVIGSGTNNRIFAMAQQPNGYQVIGGSFISYNGTSLNRLARITRTGALDPGFNIGTGANGQVTAIAFDQSGRILIGGTFNAYNGVPRSGVARLNSNGTLDATFVTGTGITGGVVNAIAVQPDGGIIVVGTFTGYNGSPANMVVRLDTGGAKDGTYNIGTGPNAAVYAVSIDAAGRAVIGGGFATVNGISRPGIARLTTSGAVDATFNPGAGVNNSVYAVNHQRDGRILIGGLFTTYNGTAAGRMARLLRDGSYDASFATGSGFNSWVYTIVMQGDEKILAGGDFTSYNGGTRNRLVRLNTNGSVDTGFSIGSACNNWVYAITWQPEGRVTVAGGFTTFNGTARNRLVRLTSACDETVSLVVKTDAFGAQTSWELLGEGLTYPVCSGSGFANSTETTVTCCVPYGPLRLRVLDSAGDGMSTGGYVLKDASGKRIIDNANDGVFGSVSAIASNGGFTLPLSADRLIMSQFDKVDWTDNQYVVATANADVSAQWGVGDQTDDGYEFWFYDPDGGYSQRKFRNHATNGGSGSGATRACYLRNTWVGDPIPQNILLNVKVRSRVNGVNGEWGAACRYKLDPVAAACPLTKLIDTPGDQYFSCGVSRTRAQYITAKPVAAANRYEFEFVNVADGYSYTIQGTTYQRTLGWATPALVPGHTYQVRVHASRDNGATWCPWGETCAVTISGPGAMAEAPSLDHLGAIHTPEMTVWPNPSNGEAIQIDISGLDDEAPMDVTVMDIAGKLIHQHRHAVQGPTWRSTIGNEQALPTGQYFLRVTQGERTWQQRFVVTH